MLDSMVTGDDLGEEAQLVGRASRGDAGAVDDLLRRHLPDLERFVARRSGPVARAMESRSDLVQSVCRELLEAIEADHFEYRGEAAFRAWLQTAALNKLRHRGRHWTAAKRDGLRQAGGSSTLGAEALDSRTPSRDAAAGEAVERAERALASLPARYREVVRLARIEGLSHREIGARLGVSEANSRMLLTRALARLATALDSSE